MRVEGSDYRTVWMEEATVCLIEQNLLPFDFRIYRAGNYRDTCTAISTMIVRGAGAIGATAGFAMAQAYLENGSDPAFVETARQAIKNTRPINVAETINAIQQKHNTVFGNGYGKLKEETFRIAHMGDITLDDLKELLGWIDEEIG